MGMKATQYAKSRGISHQAVYKAVREGRLRKLPDGTIEPASAESDEAMASVRRDPVVPPTGSVAQPATSMAQAKLANEVLRVRRARLELEVREGKFVSADHVRSIWFTKIRAIRDRFHDLPSRVAAPLVAVAVNENTRNAEMAVRLLLEDEIRALLNELSGEPSLPPSGDPA